MSREEQLANMYGTNAEQVTCGTAEVLFRALLHEELRVSLSPELDAHRQNSELKNLCGKIVGATYG